MINWRRERRLFSNFCHLARSALNPVFFCQVLSQVSKIEPKREGPIIVLTLHAPEFPLLECTKYHSSHSCATTFYAYARGSLWNPSQLLFLTNKNIFFFLPLLAPDRSNYANAEGLTTLSQWHRINYTGEFLEVFSVKFDPLQGALSHNSLNVHFVLAYAVLMTSVSGTHFSRRAQLQ